MKKENNELTQLVKTSGLEVSKQNEITETLDVFFNKAIEWDETIKSIVITSPDEVGKMKIAKEMRLTLKNYRLEGEKVVKCKRGEVKYVMANYVLEDKLWLKAGQIMEAVYKNLETKAEEKEKFAERWERKVREERKEERAKSLKPYFENPDEEMQYIDLLNMPDESFNNLLASTKLAYEQKIEAEKKVETERIKKEKAELEENERIRKENKRLEAEAIEKEKLAKIGSEKQAKILEKERAKAEAERKILEEIVEIERKHADKLQTEIKAKRETEEKENQRIETEKKAEIETERKAKLLSDKEKIIAFAGFIEKIGLPDVSSNEAKGIIINAGELILKINKYLLEKAETL